MWLNLIVAHTLEALPLVSMLSMRQISNAPAIYEDESGVRLLVSGQGQRCAADGVRILLDASNESDCAWLNIGIAGHQSMDIGSCVVANKIVQRSTGNKLYPIPFHHELAVSELHTVDKPELNYPEDVAYDMEAAGFFEAASQASILELVQCVKIVSDNAESSVENISKQFLQELFETNQSAISSFIKSLKDIYLLHQQSLLVPESLKAIFNRIHVTATQKVQLLRLSQRVIAFGLAAELENIFEIAISERMDARNLVARLISLLEQQEKAF